MRRLKVQYEMFFAGSLKRQPLDLRREVDQIIHGFSNTRIRSYAHRFQFNSIVSKYNAHIQLWSKQLRAREEGGTRVNPATTHAPHPAPGPAAAATDGGPEECFKLSVADLGAETESMRRLYDRYQEARAAAATSAKPLKLESFVRQIAKQAEEIRQNLGCDSIEFRILKKGDSVSLKARAAAQEPKA